MNSEFNNINATITNRHFKNPVDTELIVVRNICSAISNQTIEVARTTHDHPRDLPHPDFNNNGDNLNIDILIRGDFYWGFVSGNIRKGRTGLITLETTLGWVLSGNVGVSSFKNEPVSTHILKLGCAKVETSADTFSERYRILLNEVKKFWEIEDISSKPCMNHLDQGDRIHESFKSSIEFGDGRYTVGLPWKTDRLMLPDNFAPSKQRLELLVKGLKRQPTLLQKYDIILEQEKTDIIKPVNDSEIIKPSEVHYIPHREVVRDDRATAKVRII